MRHAALILSLFLLLFIQLSAYSQEQTTEITESYREMPTLKNIALMESYSLIASLYASHPDLYGDVVLGYTYTGISGISLLAIPLSLSFQKNSRNKWLDASTLFIISAGVLVNSRYNLDWGTGHTSSQKFVRNLIDHNLIFAGAIFIPYLLDRKGRKASAEQEQTSALNIYFGGNSLCMKYTF